ncbi:MAG: hypothetical protein AB7H96_14745 [Vicinamibacterales bacterium]
MPSRATAANPRTPTAPTPDTRSLVLVLSVLALAQAGFMLLYASGGARWLALGLALAGLVAQLRQLGLLAVCIVSNLALHVASVPMPIAGRLGYVGLFAAYGAVGTAVLLSQLPFVRFVPAMAVAGVLAAGAVSAETQVPRLVPPAVIGLEPVRWEGVDLDRAVNGFPPPYAVSRTVYPSNPRGYFERAEPQGGRPRFTVSYELNALGCRGDDAVIPNPGTTLRILLLGGSGAFGIGVREEDTFARRLEQSAKMTGGRPIDVINCAVYGSATPQQVTFYEEIAYRYAPDVVLLSLSTRDNLSRQQERDLGFIHQPGRLEEFLFSARLLQWARHERRRPYEYGATVESVVRLRETLRAGGVRFAAFLFRHEEPDERWGALERAVSSRLKEGDTPFTDLGVAAVQGQAPGALTVHPLDDGPNDVAHAAAATALERFLRSNGIIG